MRLATCLLALAGLVLSACSDVSYVGNSYAPTTDVKFYFRQEEVPAGVYETIGKVTASAPASGDSSLNNDIRKKAMEVGADAVLLLSSSRRKTGTSVVHSANTDYTSKDRKHHRKGNVTTADTVTRKDIITDFVEAQFLRRKDRNLTTPVNR